MAHLVENGRLDPLLAQETFAFVERGEAHRRLEQGEAVGKVSLVRDR
ncbi:zinc-binding dehydrogenase [Halobium palmae]|uniref:Zinc-binding dehydrogenase n=1 Tax=Halobium palmae TaxID=1776492 RepID=A0ABD5RY50_9EURY